MRLYCIVINILSLLFAIGVLYAQQSPSVTGRVIDKTTGEPLPGASVVLQSNGGLSGDVTDDLGVFKIENAAPGKYVLKISSLGYETLTVPEVEISQGLNSIPPVRLSPSSTAIDEVVVKSGSKDDGEPQNPMAVASAKSFTIETTERYAASLRDPSRLVLSFAGVKGQSDIANGIVVRGNAPKGVLWRVEGVDVPDPNHFSQEGYGGGAVCMMSGQVIGKSDFYTGAFPAQYGNAMSAVFDISLREGKTDRTHYYLQAGMMGFEGGIEGPFNKEKNSSYLVNYRYSTLKLFERIGFDIGNTISTYQDLNFKLSFPTGKSGAFSVFGIGGMSEVVAIQQKTRKKNEKSKSYDMATVGVSHSYSLNAKNHLRSTVAFSANRETLDKDEHYNVGNTLPAYRTGASNMFLRGVVELHSHLSSRTSMVSGMRLSGIRFNIDDIWDISKIKGTYRNADITYLLQAYSEVKYSLSEKWTALAGLHALYFGYNHNYAIEPRGGINYQLNKKHSLFLAAGLHSRLESFACYMIEDPFTSEQPNRELGMTRAVHVVFGLEAKPVNDLKIKTELYYQYLFNVPVSADENSSFSMLNFQERYTTMELVNNGLGKNYGAELTIEKMFSRNYYVLANGSLFNSIYYAADGLWRNTRFNANYIVSLTTGKDFPFGRMKKSWVFGLNARMLWDGGERKWKTEYEEQYKDYFRLDTRASIARKRERTKWMLAVDVQNTTNRKNESSLEEIKPMGILPVLTFRVEM